MVWQQRPAGAWGATAVPILVADSGQEEGMITLLCLCLSASASAACCVAVWLLTADNPLPVLRTVRKCNRPSETYQTLEDYGELWLKMFGASV
eukprot:SAG25_NODE_495_length_7403_cov_7.136911_1_plen_92_part_10